MARSVQKLFTGWTTEELGFDYQKGQEFSHRQNHHCGLPSFLSIGYWMAFLSGKTGWGAKLITYLHLCRGYMSLCHGAYLSTGVITLLSFDSIV
jgi:hypothetical protein